jgi:hypothetical protein
MTPIYEAIRRDAGGQTWAYRARTADDFRQLRDGLKRRHPDAAFSYWVCRRPDLGFRFARYRD